MRVLVLQHIACEHPGVFSEVMRERGVEAVAVEVDEGEPLPDWREFDAVLAMGGPMGAGDDAEHPWLAPERELVREAVEAGRPFLGVCLGVQLLAAALGAPVYAAERPEVGLLEVELTDAGPRRPAVRRPRRALRLPAVARRHLRPAGGRGAARELAAIAEPGVPGRRARLRRPVPPRGHRRDGASSGARSPPIATRCAATLGEEAGAEFIADVERRADELHPPARRLFANWLDVAEGVS